MITARKGWLGLPALVVLGGCVGASFVQTGDVYAPRAANCHIEVFSSALPARDYEELGIVEGEGSLWKADIADVLPKLKEQACYAGGDGIVIQSSQVTAEGEDGHRHRHTYATVIRWVGEGR